MGDAFGEMRPNSRGFRVEAEVEFDHPLIGRQIARMIDVKPDTFRREIARARTFGFMRDVTSLWNAGYALGASLENTLVVSGQRHPQSRGHAFPRRIRPPQDAGRGRRSGARGRPLCSAHIASVRGGHKLNHAVLCALMANDSAWTWVEEGCRCRCAGAMPR